MSTQFSGPKNRAFYRSAARLIADAADAVEHAHSLGIVHRDVKPGNLLVDQSGKVYVADFGLARFTTDAGLTMSGDLLGTLRYMAPEQALARHGLVDHRADVYGLGCTLYELLTGRPAVDGADKHEVLKKIAFEEPAPPRKLDRSIPSELETVTLKALAKNPTERYATAGELAEDLRRWLSDQTIKARPPTLRQRAAKWARRHRPVVAATFVILVLAVLGLSVGWFVIFQKEREVRAAYESESHERSRAETNLTTALEAINQMLTRVGSKRLAHVPQMETVRAEVLNDALEFYQRLLQKQSTDPALRVETAATYDWIGRINQLLGQNQEAALAYRESTRIVRSLVEDHPDDPKHRHSLAGRLHNLALVNQDMGHLSEAERGFRQALELQERVVRDSPQTADHRMYLANMYEALGNLLDNTIQFAEAERDLRSALTLRENLAKEFPNDANYRRSLAQTQTNLGIILDHTGHKQKAEEAYRQALEVMESLVLKSPGVPEYRDTLSISLQNLGVLLARTGRYPEAEAAYKKALPNLEKLVNDFPNTPKYRQRLGELHYELGYLAYATQQFREAEQSCRQAVALIEELTVSFPQRLDLRRTLALIHHELAEVLKNSGRQDEAVKAYREAMAIREKVVQAAPRSALDQSELGGIQNDLANELRRQGDFVSACELLEQAIEHQQSALEADAATPRYKVFLRNHYWLLGQTLSQQKEHGRAASSFEKSLALFPNDPHVLNDLAWLLADCPDPKLRDPSTAVKLAKKAVTLSSGTAGFHNTLGIAHYRAGNWQDAIASIEKSMELAKQSDSTDLYFLAMAHHRLGDREQARKCFAQAVEWMDKNKPGDPELKRFRIEAAELLGIKKAPEPKGPARDPSP